jgi:uncharacterized protein (TIGR03085 family)
MSTAPWSVRERLALCDLFESIGPDAPTLCEGWATVDLAAHLVLRERDVLAAPGIVFGGAARRLTERAMERYRQRGFHWLVDTVRSGPPLRWRLPGLGERLNLIEFFVHHEDVRRANGMSARGDVDDLEDALWSVLRSGATYALHRLPDIGVELRHPEGDSIRARRGTPVVRMVGRPAELVLYLNGRRAAADVELDGPPEAVATLAAARLGV